ncbi:biotin/lipoyl-containing protein, partial [Zavarzinia sp.]|uniref:acetyl-CoA carboxylase biotin carboxyl carrier protein subunit n=1 Tax=Zavarzinia sp. TaxID=2027920 RepID=UPI003BB78B27
QADNWRATLPVARRLHYLDGETLHLVTILAEGQGWRLTVDGHSCLAGASLDASGGLTLDLDGRRLRASVAALREARHVFLDGAHHILTHHDPLHQDFEDEGEAGGLVAPMPGKIVALLAEVGSKLEKGTPLLVLEAMKMEHTINAPAAGTLRDYCFAVGDQVTEGAALVHFEAEG